jgi:hypothetical protein
VDDVVQQALDAMRRRDWERVKPLVHPYVHWTDESGRTRRGRARLVAALADSAEVAVLEADELRDGQIYRLRMVCGPQVSD